MSSVLFDAPGPRGRSRQRVYTVISGVIVLALVAAAIWKLNDEGQFAGELWEPFVTPRIVNALLGGLLATLRAAFFAIILSMAFGLVFGTAKLSEHRLISWPAWTVVEFFRAVPLLLVIIGIFYYFGAQPGSRAFWALVTGLTLYNGAVLAEVFRAGINALPSGQAEAAYALGMRKSQVMRLVLLPQAVRIMLPAIISQAVVALKDTTLGYAVVAPGFVVEMRPVYQEFRNLVPAAIVMALVFVVINLGLSRLATLAERRLAGGRRLRVQGVGTIPGDDSGTTPIG